MTGIRDEREMDRDGAWCGGEVWSRSAPSGAATAISKQQEVELIFVFEFATKRENVKKM